MLKDQQGRKALLLFVKSIHTYKDVWKPKMAKALLLQQKPDKGENKLAIAALRYDRVGGYTSMHPTPLCTS